MKRPRISAASNDLFLSLPRSLIHGEKKPAQRNGQKVGILGSNETKALLIVRATDLPGERSLFPLLPFKHSWRSRNGNPQPNVLVVLHGAGCLPVSMSQPT